MPRPTLRRYFRHGLFPQLLVFEAVARLGGVTRAAEELHLAQSTVSTQLKKLSGNLGVALFEPRGRGLQLTQAGSELLAACGELVQLLARTEERLAMLRARKPEVLRIAAAPGARQLAARLLACFCVRYPGVQASLHISNRAQLIEDLAVAKHDLYLIPAPQDRVDVVFQPVAVELLHVYAPAGHALAGARAIQPERLAGEAIVLREPGSSMRETMLAACAVSDLQRTARVELESDEAVAEAVAAGLGLALLPEGVARIFARSGSIVPIDLTGFPLRREWVLAYTRGRQLSPAAALFLREAAEDAHGITIDPSPGARVGADSRSDGAAVET